MRKFIFSPWFFNLIWCLCAAVAVVLIAVPFTKTSVEKLAILNVYTYDSFASEWGAGPKIKQAFEQQCNCEVRYVAVDSSTGILSRVQLEGANSRADVVLGMDNNILVEAHNTGLLAPHNVDLASLDLPFAWDDQTFLPFDYGYLAFIYDHEKLTKPPSSLQQLVAADDSLKIIIQDPRSSTSGLGLMLWMKAVYEARAADAWGKLSDNIVTVTKSWSEAYGLFLDGEADMVLSYTTSPAYHIHVEGTNQYRAAAFNEGHGLQIEVAAQLKTAPHPDLAQQFMEFITTAGFQSAIPTGNWMYPVKNIAGGLPPAFDKLVTPTASFLIDPHRVAANKAKWVDEFIQALSQ